MSPRMERIKRASQLFVSMGYTRQEIARMYRAERSHERMLQWMERGGFVSNRLSERRVKP